MAKHEKPLHIDMSFDETLRRYVSTDPRELTEPKKASKLTRAKRARPRNTINRSAVDIKKD